MTATIFVDTNVFVYARDNAYPQKQKLAMQWVDRLWREQSGRTSMQVLSELYVTLTRKLRPGLSPDDAWEDVSALMAWDPASLDRETLTRGREIHDRYKLNWWDSLIVAAAQLQDCEILLTEDLQEGMRFGQVVAQNPFHLRVSEVRASSQELEVDVPRHRRPGRPRTRA
ncbi:MAG: PIN domain-containing protein [Steroidobacteraceae bacterium]